MAQTHTYTHIVCCFCNVFPLFPGVLQAGDQSSKRDSLHRIMAYALLVQLQVSCKWVRKWVTKNSHSLRTACTTAGVVRVGAQVADQK